MRCGRVDNLRLILIFSVLLLGVAAWTVGADRDAAYDKARERMVRAQLEGRGISDPVTLEAMASVPRHLFVSSKLASEAYTDGPLPIGFGQTISQPYIVAFMTETARPGPKKKILEVGTGSGYQAAVLAETGAEVYTIEIIPELAESASARLRRLGYAGVHVKQGDGYFGWEEHAPFDAVVVTAAAPFVPPPLLDQLKTGGRMVIPVGSPFLLQTLMLVEKGEEETVSRSLMPVRFVPFRRDG
jgi:protein-L-isoaspartate(D-aspartate) O-methyltransferase